MLISTYLSRKTGAEAPQTQALLPKIQGDTR
jgi:hypothetical protein